MPIRSYELVLGVILTIIGAAEAAAADEDAELAANPRFVVAQQGKLPDGWTEWKPVWQTATCRVQGTADGLLVDAPGQPYAVGGVWQDLRGIKPQQAYTIRAVCRAERIPSPFRALYVGLQWTCAGSPLHPAGMMVRGPQSSGDTLTFQDTLVAPAEADGARLSLELKWPQGGSVCWKEVSVRPTQPPPPRKVKIGTVYLRPRQSTPEKNLDLFCQQIDEAGRLGLDIVCLGEAITMVGTPNNLNDVAEPIPGPASERLGKAAAKNRLWVVAGLTERAGDRVYNTAVLLDRAGHLAGKYRKIHLPREEWRQGIAPGEVYPVFQTDFGTVAIQICYDWFFPEVGSIFGLRGAEILFAPTWGTTFPDKDGRAEGETVFRVRARDNGIYLVPSVYDGSSMVIDPMGRILASNRGREGVFWAEVDLNQREPLEWVGHWRSTGPRHRMPLTYGPMLGDPAAEAPRPKFIYVAPNGNDAWSGTLAEANADKSDGPFATLERARDEIRKIKTRGGLPAGGVTVQLRGGVFYREHSFELTQQDSGTEAAPIEYRGSGTEEVRLVGGRLVGGWQPVSDPAVLSRLDEAARGHVLCADLKALGITDFGPVSGGGMELFFDDKPMTLARWPNEGFVRIVDVVGGQPYDIRGTVGDKVGKFTYEGDRPKRWAGEKDLWVHGYWFWDWSDQRHKVESIDTEHRIISVVPPYHGYGYRKGQWFYALNVLAELDQPGEWYVDREAGVLYFWPPGPIEQGRPTVSTLDTLVKLQDAANVTIRGLTLEVACGTAVTVSGGTHNRLVGCTLRNIGGWAARIDGGTNHGVVACDIFEIGNGGIGLVGGDRPTLTPARHYAENNHIHHYGRWNRMYQPGISMDGVGIRAAHNLIHTAPHIGILFGGNDHLMELNEIHHVCQESNDAGAIYAGRDWTMRGTVIRHNFMHHVSGFEGRGCVGVYLDDMFCGTLIVGNVFYEVTRAAFIGGGRDNVVENNIFVDCRPALHIDARALGWAADSVDTTMKERLAAMPYEGPLWRERYPQLPKILEEEPAAPRGNVVARNVCSGGKWEELYDNTGRWVKFQDNLVGEAPRFVDTAKMKFQLRDDSPVYQRVPGFEKIPFDQIGLVKTADRPRLPQAPMNP